MRGFLGKCVVLVLGILITLHLLNSAKQAVELRLSNMFSIISQNSTLPFR
jgi:hypothetical protein